MTKVLVVGGGAAGLMAAYGAALHGAEVLLFEKNGEITKLTQVALAQGNENNWLILTKKGDISTDKKFIKIVVTSKVPLKNVLIKWTNYSL